MTAYAELIRSYADAYNKLAVLDPEGKRGTPDWADWARCLAVVYIVAESAVANEARAIDAALWDVKVHAGDGRIPSDDWLRLREPLEQVVLTFVNLARAELGSLGAPLPALWVRPTQ